MKAWIDISAEDCEAKADRQEILKPPEDNRGKNQVLRKTQASHTGITSSEPRDGGFQKPES